MINKDWKKQAAQVLDEKAVERAFMDQAYTFVANKAGPLMEDPFRLGFEVVYSNDDHTRMVGIFAFRVDRQLLYVPVFFLNGQIRGTDLLYCHDTKSFKPNNKDWATFMVEKHKGGIGEGIPKGDARKRPADIELEDIAYPPANYHYQYKSGSEEEADAPREMFEKLANSFTESMDSDVKALVKKYLAGLPGKHSVDNEKPEDADCPEGEDKAEDKEQSKFPEFDTVKGAFLKRFLLEDGGADAAEKIASALAGSKDFAELAVGQIPLDAMMPAELLEQTKRANDYTVDLVLYTGGVEAFSQRPIGDMEKSAAAQDEFFEKGYYLWDDRAPGKLQPATKDLTIELCRPGEPGVYKVLCADGELREAYLAAPAEQRFSPHGEEEYATHPDSWECSQWDEDQPRELTVVMKDGGESGECRHARGEFVKTLSDCIRDEELDTEMSTGKSYRVFDAEGGVFSEPVHCVGKGDDNGITTYEVACRYGPKFELRHNADMDNSSFSANFLGAHTFFIPLSSDGKVKKESYGDYYDFRPKSLPKIGDDHTLTKWVLDHGVKEACLIRDRVEGDRFSLKAGDRKQTFFLPRVKMAAALAQDLHLHARCAEALLDEAAETGRCNFYVGGPGFEKFAAPIDIVDSERWRNDYDPTFDVGLDYPQAFALGTDTQGPQPPDQRIGDAYDPGMGMTSEDGQSLSGELLSSSPPEELEQLRSMAGVPNVFEHGMVGSLLKTYDSIAMVDKYLPDLESALDRLGRLLFLMYWKPRDFEDAYGADDMANMENQILSAFQSFGELVLDLIKKSQSREGAPGNVAMYSGK